MVVDARSLGAAPGWAADLLESERVAHLGVVDDDGHPRVLPVTFAVAEGGGAVVSAVDDKPKRVGGGELARVRWLRARPAAALTVDVYDDDWSRLAWVQLLGAVEILDVGQDPAAMRALAARYAAYRERAPGGPLLRLAVGRVLCWRAAEG